ncbi:MAG: hypothetical protein ACPMAQ_10365 [Phycisphaerae bacterium]
MTKSKQQIIDEITTHIRKRGGEPGTWYVGTSNDSRAALFDQHKVKEKGDRWIRRRADSAIVAREVQEHFVSTLATDGKAAVGETAHMVYAYRKAPHTRP